MATARQVELWHSAVLPSLRAELYDVEPASFLAPVAESALGLDGGGLNHELRWAIRTALDLYACGVVAGATATAAVPDWVDGLPPWWSGAPRPRGWSLADCHFQWGAARLEAHTVYITACELRPLREAAELALVAGGPTGPPPRALPATGSVFFAGLPSRPGEYRWQPETPLAGHDGDAVLHPPWEFWRLARAYCGLFEQLLPAAPADESAVVALWGAACLGPALVAARLCLSEYTDPW